MSGLLSSISERIFGQTEAKKITIRDLNELEQMAKSGCRCVRLSDLKSSTAGRNLESTVDEKMPKLDFAKLDPVSRKNEIDRILADAKARLSSSAERPSSSKSDKMWLLGGALLGYALGGVSGAIMGAVLADVIVVKGAITLAKLRAILLERSSSSVIEEVDKIRNRVKLKDLCSGKKFKVKGDSISAELVEGQVICV